MKKFALVSKNDQSSVRVATEIQKKLTTNGLVYDEKNPDIVCVVGGDGTFLSAIHRYINKLDEVIFTGIHTGTLGFFTDYSLTDLNRMIDDISTKEPIVDCKKLIEAKIKSSNQTIYSINEISIESYQTKIIDVFVDEEKLESFHGNGLSLCSQAGSTGLNRSLGGAIIQPGLNVLQLTEMGGIHHKFFRSLFNPIIFSDKTVIRFTSEDLTNAKLCFDRYNMDLGKDEEIICKLSDKCARIARYSKSEWTRQLERLY